MMSCFRKEPIIFEQLEIVPPFLKQELQDKLLEVERILKSGNINSLSKSRSTWNEIIELLIPKDDFKTLFYKAAKGENIAIDNRTYAKSLLFDQFARRKPRERSLENLGLVNMVYPELDKVTLPEIAEALNISLDEWKDLLKIAIDYTIRYQFHFYYDDSLRLFSSSFYRSDLIYPSDSDEPNVKKWPQYKPNSIIQSRLVLLICAGLGWHSQEEINKGKEDQLNDLLNNIWRVLRSRILTAENNGYKIDLTEKSQFEIAGEEYLCPVRKRLLDKVFRGYSPWIKGALSPGNIGYYNTDDRYNTKFPTYSYPYHLNGKNKKMTSEKVESWLDENSRRAKRQRSMEQSS